MLENNNKENIAKEKKIIKKALNDKNKNNLNNAKLECEEIGFKKGTEAFGECILDLTE